MKTKNLDWLISVWIIFCITVILGYFIFSAIIKGSAIWGCTDGDHYFVASHDVITEVSEAMYNISYVWGIIFVVFIPLTPIGGFLIAYILEKKEKQKNRLE